MTKRELIFAAFNNQETERVPVGFWFHFAPDELYNDSPEVIKKNTEGHLKFYREFQPDFVKLMSDGYFTYPNPAITSVRTAADLKKIRGGYAEEWIRKQVALVSSLTGSFGKETAAFYNIFAPATYLKWQLRDQGVSLGELADEDPEAVRDALNEIAGDIAKLAQAVIRDGGADGIYLSVQNLQDSKLTGEEYLKYIAPSEKKVLEAANELSGNNILHICGYKGARNDLKVYAGYPAKVFNWAVVVEGVSLEEGKKLFGGRAVLGGFANTEGDLLYRGTEGESETFRSALLTVSHGQMEAALSVGLSRVQAYVRVIIPQALVAALPNLCNATVNLLKSTSLAYMMTVKDITAIAKLNAAKGYNYIEAYLVIFVIYILLCTTVQLLFYVMESILSGYKKRITI